MYRTMKVFIREYKSIVKTKMFIVILILAPLFMSSGFIVPLIAKKNVDTNDRKLAVIDRSGVLGETLLEAVKTRNSSEIYDKETGKKVMPAYLIEIVEPDDTDPVRQRLELSNRVRSKNLHAFVEIGKDVVHPHNPQTGSINYYGQNPIMDNMRSWLGWPINNHIRQLRLKDAGIDVAEVQDLFIWLGVNGMELVTVNKDTGEFNDARRSNRFQSFGIPVIMCMFMYFMMMLVSQSLLGSVIEEKTQRIAEVLLGCVKPFEFMMGKILGGIGVAITALGVYLIGVIAVIIHLGYGTYIPYKILPWLFSYMILAILMYGAIATALGSLASDMKDTQSLAFLVMIPIILSLFVVISILRNPSSTYAVWISLVPVFTPMVMLFRLGAPGGVPVWQQILGITDVILFALFSVWVGGRVFRIGLLVQGEMPKLKNVIRWALRG